MKKYFIFLFCISFLTTVFGQTQTIKIKKEKFVPATFPGGKEGIRNYLDTSIGQQINRRLIPSQKVEFNAQVDIAPTGKIEKVNLLRGSGDKLIDSIYIDAVKKMPAWKPATNVAGKNCEDQQFVSFEVKYESRVRVRKGP